MLIFSALPHQTDIELHGTANGLDADAFVVAMQGAALLGGQIHGRETVHMVADTAVVAAVRALHHQIRCYQTALPGACHSAGDLIPCRQFVSLMRLGFMPSSFVISTAGSLMVSFK